MLFYHLVPRNTGKKPSFIPREDRWGHSLPDISFDILRYLLSTGALVDELLAEQYFVMHNAPVLSL